MSNIRHFDDYEDLLSAATELLVDGGQLLPLANTTAVIGFFHQGNVWTNLMISTDKAVATGWRDYGYTIGGIREVERRVEEMIENQVEGFWGKLENSINI